MSRSEERETAVQKYFTKTPDEPEYNDTTLATIGTVAGAICVLIGLVSFNNTWGLLLIGAVVVYYAGPAWLKNSNENNNKRSNYEEAYEKAEPKPSDKQIDNWHNGDLKRIRKQSLAKLDLVPEQVMGNPNDPIMVVGPSEGARLALGEDGILRFSGHDIVIVYLTDYQYITKQG